MGDRSAWHRHEHGWAHRPWWKVAINTVLRLVQPGVRRKWVIFTRTWTPMSGGTSLPPIVTGYGFGRIEHRTAGELIHSMTLPEPAPPPRPPPPDSGAWVWWPDHGGAWLPDDAEVPRV